MFSLKSYMLLLATLGFLATAQAQNLNKVLDSSHAQSVQQAQLWLEQKKPRQAFELLQPLETQLAGQRDFDYLYGQTALQVQQATVAAYVLWGLGLDSNINNATSLSSMALPAFDGLNFRLSRQVPILLSETTRSQAPQFSYRTIDKVRVKGRQQALYISQPLDSQVLSDTDLVQILTLYQQALDYYFAQQWEQALMQFQQLQQHNPQEKIYTLYIERIHKLQDLEISTTWEGIFDHEYK